MLLPSLHFQKTVELWLGFLFTRVLLENRSPELTFFKFSMKQGCDCAGVGARVMRGEIRGADPVRKQ